MVRSGHLASKWGVSPDLGSGHRSFIREPIEAQRYRDLEPETSGIRGDFLRADPGDSSLTFGKMATLLGSAENGHARCQLRQSPDHISRAELGEVGVNAPLVG